MPSVRGRFEYADDLTPGRSKDGGLHHNLYDDQQRLVGHAKFIPDDENAENAEANFPPPPFFDAGAAAPESEPRSRERLDPEEIAEVLVLLVKFAGWSAPRLKRWWVGQALPFVKATRGRIARARKADVAGVPDEPSAPAGHEPPRTPQEASAEPDESRARMGEEEALERLAAALRARLFSDEQMRIVGNARIESGGAPIGESAAEKFDPQRIAHSIGLILEGKAASLSEESSAEIERLLVLMRAANRPSSIEA